MNADEKENRSRIPEEAAEWFARMQHPTPTLEERRAFYRWLRLSTEHVSEYLRAAMLDRILSETPLEYPLAKDELIEHARSEIVSLNAHAIATEIGRQAPRSNWRWRLAAMAATVALTALLAIAAKIAWFENVIETEPGQWQMLTLADGTVVRSGPNTRLRLAFGDDVRLVHFAGGEAVFDVAADPRRPFAVRTGVADVRATGTQFGVALRGGRIVVTVAHGSVVVARGEIAARDAALRNPVESAAGVVLMTLEAGEELSISPSGALVAQDVNPHTELAWADRRLIFARGTVADAAREFNSRNRIQITITDPMLARRQIRGVFDAGDPDAFAAMLTRLHGGSLRVERGTLHLYRGASADER
jgi:transmembrane sensor